MRLRPANRWHQLVAGVVGMMAVAGLLFVWPLLRSPSGPGLAEALAASENAFAAFIFTEIMFAPLESWLGERAPRWLLVGAGVGLVVLGAFAGAAAAGVRAKVAWSVLGGAGAGLVYGGTVAKSLRSFTERKALAIGVTGAACVGVLVLAAGAILAMSSPAAMPLLIVLGAGQAVVIVIATLFILAPPRTPPTDDWRA
jgi:OFA family oxalate/formate antiporter-like MFS transporter